MAIRMSRNPFFIRSPFLTEVRWLWEKGCFKTSQSLLRQVSVSPEKIQEIAAVNGLLMSQSLLRQVSVSPS